MEYRIEPKLQTGDEILTGTNQTILDFWRWAHSDIACNAERGKLAEFIIKCATNSHSPFRAEWDAVDIITPEGIRIEVKSASYLQSWKCSTLSKIRFDIAPRKSWDSENNIYYDTIDRHSDIYIFCLFASKDPTTADILDLSQWEFYILKTAVLNQKIPFQKSIGLDSLIKIGATHTDYFNIRKIIKEMCPNAHNIKETLP